MACETCSCSLQQLPCSLRDNTNDNNSNSNNNISNSGSSRRRRIAGRSAGRVPLAACILATLFVVALSSVAVVEPRPAFVSGQVLRGLQHLGAATRQVRLLGGLVRRRAEEASSSPGRVELAASIRFKGEKGKEDVEKAVAQLSGSMMGSWGPLQLEVDANSFDTTRLTVLGIHFDLESPAPSQQQLILDLKSHFAPAGKIDFVNIGVGEVRFETQDLTEKAVQQLNGSLMGGRLLRVALDPLSTDGTRVKVFGLKSTCQWYELKDYLKATEVAGAVFVAGPGSPGKQR
ncbi:unnamed protein product [Polarella glacialis]|uniref:RRM domain-containing protein n=1 Tax=Polarella glacialis TaxID=89957 RepID=A0A813DBI8_POLGL|nr:unnamed protein product [Polarella glacialis]CAE8661802.1 unnamed protein product [Polarella glacialis]